MWCLEVIVAREEKRYQNWLLLQEAQKSKDSERDPMDEEQKLDYSKARSN